LNYQKLGIQLGLLPLLLMLVLCKIGPLVILIELPTIPYPMEVEPWISLHEMLVNISNTKTIKGIEIKIK